MKSDCCPADGSYIGKILYFGSPHFCMCIKALFLAAAVSPVCGRAFQSNPLGIRTSARLLSPSCAAASCRSGGFQSPWRERQKGSHDAALNKRSQISSEETGKVGGLLCAQKWIARLFPSCAAKVTGELLKGPAYRLQGLSSLPLPCW